MPAKKNKARTSSRKLQPMTTSNKIAVLMICACFVLVGLFFVYKSFAAAVGLL